MNAASSSSRWHCSPAPGRALSLLGAAPGLGPEAITCSALPGIGRQDGCPGAVRLRRDIATTKVAVQREHKVRQVPNELGLSEAAARRPEKPLFVPNYRSGTCIPGPPRPSSRWAWARPLVRQAQEALDQHEAEHVRR